jgi:hypothetical protein
MRISSDRTDSETPMKGVVNGVSAGLVLWTLLYWLFV